MTKATTRRLDAFDQWCLRRILRIHYGQHVTNAEIRRQTASIPVSDMIRRRRLCLFGHVVRSGAEMDHRRALQAAIRGPRRQP